MASTMSNVKAKPKSEPDSEPPEASPTPAPVISLDEDEQIKEATKRSIKDFLTAGPASKKPKTGSEHDGVICILSDSDNDSVNSEGTLDLCGDGDDDDDEVMIVDPSTETSTSTSVSEIDANADDELVVVGEKNVMRLPHMRQHCTKCKFVEDIRTKSCNSWNNLARVIVIKGKMSNPKTCDLCYCFVCDKLASECTSWSSTPFNPDDHCHASDKGENMPYYKNLRAQVKRGMAVTPTPTSQFSSSALASASLSSVASGTPVYSQHGFSRGPFKPDDPGAKKSKVCTKCRKCGWYSKFDHHNFTKIVAQDQTTGQRTLKYYPVGIADFCRACSRVVSKKDFAKDQSKPYKSKPGDILLGTKVISFKVKARDPRKAADTKKNWEQYEGKSNNWVYNEAEMEEDFFHHRIGKRPELKHILFAIPVVKADSIPESSSTEVSPMETEALLLDDRNDLSLLRELETFDISGGYNTTPLDLNLHARWDKTTRKGTIEIKVYLSKSAFVGTGSATRQGKRQALFSRLLGCWYSVDRFKLSDLTCGMRAKPLSEEKKKDLLLRTHTGLIPSRLTEAERRDLLDDVGNEEALAAYNTEVDAISKNLSFKASESSDNCGVIASSDTSFAGTLKRIASSCLVDDVISRSNYLGRTSVATKLGIASCHRSMRPYSRGSEEYLRNVILHETNGFTSYLDQKEHGLIDNLHQKFRKSSSRCSTMNGLLQQLENLGHAPAEQADGLNVELFDFQRQAVGWALERERQGGIERFLWTKLPTECSEVLVGANKMKPVQLYYSPILDLFSQEEPNDTRGGLIAAQMGLGKTVISLSLVLLNPAPEAPLSGTTVQGYTAPATIPTDKNSPPWPSTLALPPDAPKKRGSIFSRGTLVVCNVSLVGQWIDEAKSKLKDPGLVYSYHGHNRNRDPMVLAKNGVVVTTYAILASDANHHAQKSKDPDYCAPCEQVRWWRIICDESHSIRDTNTRNFKALKRLTAANKWAVTGTPMNTTPRDLKGQLSFIGVSHLDKMFSLFASSMEGVFKTAKRRRSWNGGTIGPFLFLMQNVMIRHAISQTARDSKVGIMTLPPKEERVIEIEFNAAERKEYDRVQKKAATMYEQLKATGKVNRHYLKLNSALLPLRIACSGGQLAEGQINRKTVPKENLTGKELQYDLDSTQECSICLDAMEEPKATICKPVPHIFCKECIQGVFSGASSIPCPCCRATVKAEDLRDVVPKVDTNETKDKDKSEDGKKASKKKHVETLKDSDILFRSKFETLLKELIRVRDTEPGSKSLVFSQFTSTLQWMKQELPKHGFQFRTLSGNMTMKKRSDALREFQSDPPTTIFLLSMRSGAVGINLTQANRVFLMEPAMNPALEAQAIGRVYRLGQRKPVQVLKLRMKDSFESRLVKVLKRKFDTATKPSPSESSSGEEKKSDDNDSDKNAGEKKDGKGASIDISPVTATLGHMNRDKADLMTEEFDALFGLTEPEDLPDKVSSGQTQSAAASGSRSDDSPSSTPDEVSSGRSRSDDSPSSSRSSSPNVFARQMIARRELTRNFCDCGECSDDEQVEECIVS